MRTRPRYARLIRPAAATLALWMLEGNLDALASALPGLNLSSDAQTAVHTGLLTVLCLSVAWLGCVLIDVFLWQAVVERRTGSPPPKLLVGTVRLLLLAAMLIVIVRQVYAKPIDALLVSSGVVGIVLGFALQRMISDFFCGIALNFERPFSAGDWIEIDGVAGRIVEINWRATRLVTLDQTTVVLPNSFISERRFINYDLPEHHFRTELSVTLEYGVPVSDARRVLLAAVKSAAGVRAEPAPDVLVKELGERGVVYRCRFYLNGYAELNEVRDAVASSISGHLWQAGLNVAYPKRDVYHAPMPARLLDRDAERATLLSRTELFASLPVEEIAELATGLRPRRVGAGTDVVSQGEPGASLFVVVEGLLEVKVHDGGTDRVVGQLVPGQFFGEMSLLSGEPRSATVTAASEATLFELSHETLAPVLRRRQELAGVLARVVADRRMRTEALLRESRAGDAADRRHSLAEDVLRRMRGFFKLIH